MVVLSSALTELIYYLWIIAIRKTMSEEDGKLNQHLVPQGHLLRFTDNQKKLYVHMFTDNQVVRVYRTGTRNVSAEVNYYDNNPYDDGSIENFLRSQEKRGQQSVDKVMESRSGIDVNRRVVRYVLMLLGRTIPFAISSYDGYTQHEFHLTDDDERYLRQTSIFETMDNPLMQDAGGHDLLSHPQRGRSAICYIRRPRRHDESGFGEKQEDSGGDGTVGRITTRSERHSGL